MSYTSRIDYGSLLQSALKQMMRSILNLVAEDGLPGEHHFYIGFKTQDAGVVLSKRLLQRYPEEMTIVLRHQFENLETFDDHLSVDLFFAGVRESIHVPFGAIISFEDPSSNFALKFAKEEAIESDGEEDDGLEAIFGDAEDVGGDKAENLAGDLAGNLAGNLDSETGIAKFPVQPLGGKVANSSANEAGPEKNRNAENEAKVISLDRFRKS